MASEQAWNEYDLLTAPDSLDDTALIGKADGSGYRLALSAFVSLSALAVATQAMTLTNKTIALGNNTVSGTKEEFNAALSDGDFRYAGVNIPYAEIDIAGAPAGFVLGRVSGTGPVVPVPLINDSITSNTIPLRGSGGRIVVGDPINIFDAVNKQTFDAAIGTREATANKNVALGYVGLDSDAKIPEAFLPAIAITDGVTSVDISGGTTGFQFLNGPITGSGSFTMTVANQATARGALGLGSISTQAAPSGSVVGTTGAQTLSSKTLTAPVINGYTEGLVTQTGTAFAPNLTAATTFFYTTTGNATITMPAAVAGKSLVIILQYGGAHTLTWAGAAIRWPDGTAPTATSVNGKRDTFAFICVDGVSWQTGGMNI